MEHNPFKFGSIVDGTYFTNRTIEIEQITSVLNSSNHLVMISPRRYGKSSLIYKVIKGIERPVITVDLQLVTSVEDLAAQLLKRLYRVFPAERIRQLIKHFRIIPAISLNPVTNTVDITFQPSAIPFPQLEDVLNTIEKLSNDEKKTIVAFDEFQEVDRLDTNLARQLRSVMQHHRKINYVFLGSQESMIREIFEKKKSPFYHFGYLLTLDKISREDFSKYLEKGFSQKTKDSATLAGAILDFTRCHPYYTQQLAFIVWGIAAGNHDLEKIVPSAIDEIVRIHDIDYERLWTGFNKTDRKLLIGMAECNISPLSEAFYRKYDLNTSSTVFSSIKRIMKDG
jgi:uncharacterized protein